METDLFWLNARPEISPRDTRVLNWRLNQPPLSHATVNLSCPTAGQKRPRCVFYQVAQFGNTLQNTKDLLASNPGSKGPAASVMVRLPAAPPERV